MLAALHSKRGNCSGRAAWILKRFRLRKRGTTIGQTQHRATEAAETLSRFIKADLAEDLSLAMINREFPGISREDLLRVFAICQDEAVLERARTGVAGEHGADYGSLCGFVRAR
jgi:hypothetical protein